MEVIKYRKTPRFEWLPFWRIVELESHVVGVSLFHHEIGWCRFVRLIGDFGKIQVVELENVNVHHRLIGEFYVLVENFESKMNC